MQFLNQSDTVIRVPHAGRMESSNGTTQWLRNLLLLSFQLVSDFAPAQACSDVMKQISHVVVPILK